MEKFSYRKNYWKVFSKSTTFIMWLLEVMILANIALLAYKAHSTYLYYFCMGIGLGSVHFILCSLRRLITYQSWVIDTSNKIVYSIIDDISKEVSLDEISSDKTPSETSSETSLDSDTAKS